MTVDLAEDTKKKGFQISRKRLILGLLGILGLVGSAKLAINGFSMYKDAKSRLPERILEIEKQLDDADVNERKYTFYELARNYGVKSEYEKYIPLINKLDLYENDPNVSPIIDDRAQGKLKMALGFGVQDAVALGLLPIGLLEFGNYLKRRKEIK